MKDPPEKYERSAYPSTKMLDIDGAAWTPMMRYDGNPASIQFLKYFGATAVDRRDRAGEEQKQPDGSAEHG